MTIRQRTCVTGLPQLIAGCYQKLAAYLEEHNELLSDIPFVAYYNMDLKNLEVEIGFPVARKLAGREEIESAVIPTGKVAYCMYQDAYREIEPVYLEMLEYIKNQGLEYTGCSYEYYYNGQDFPEQVST